MRAELPEFPPGRELLGRITTECDIADAASLLDFKLAAAAVFDTLDAISVLALFPCTGPLSS
jgi:hypothetical protein